MRNGLLHTKDILVKNQNGLCCMGTGMQRRLKTDVTQQKRELKVLDILMWSKLMQYVKAEGVADSGKNDLI